MPPLSADIPGSFYIVTFDSSYERQGLRWVSLRDSCFCCPRTSPCRTDCGSGCMSCSNLSWNTTDETLREVSYSVDAPMLSPVPSVSPIRIICNCRLSHRLAMSWMYAFVLSALCGVVVNKNVLNSYAVYRDAGSRHWPFPWFRICDLCHSGRGRFCHRIS